MFWLVSEKEFPAYLKDFLSVMLITYQNISQKCFYAPVLHTVEESLSAGDRALFYITAASRTAEGVAASVRCEIRATRPKCFLGIAAIHGKEKLPA